MSPQQSKASLTAEEHSLVLLARQLRDCLGTQANAHRTYLEHLCTKFLQNPSDVEEVIGDTLLKAIRAAASYDGQASLRTWLYSIAENECKMKLRERMGKVKGAVCFSQLRPKNGDSEDETVDVVNMRPDQGPSVEEMVIEPIVAESTWASIMQKAAGKWKMIDYKLFALRTLKPSQGSEPVMTFPEIASLLDRNAVTLRGRWRDHIEPILKKMRYDHSAD